MTTKKILASLLCALMVVASATPALAQSTADNPQTQYSNQISPRMSYTASAKSTLTISGSTAKVNGTVKMKATGTRVSMTTSLLCDGKVVDSWSTPTSTASTRSVIAKSVKLTTKGTYQVKTTYTVYGDSGSESGTEYSKSIKF